MATTIRAMHRNHTALRALLVAAATLLSTGAWAQTPHATPPGKAAGEKAEKAAEKAGEKAEKAGEKAEKAGDKAAKAAKDSKENIEQSKHKTAEDRATRKAKEHDAQREKLAATWKGPVNDSLRHELRRHAERLARLERIKEVAETEKDKDSAEKADKLIAKEKDRHDKWVSKNAALVKPVTTPAPATGEKKEGVK